jgi:hypothetical protein
MFFDPDDEVSMFPRNAGIMTTLYGITSQNIVHFSPITYRAEKEILNAQEREKNSMPEEENNPCHEEKLWGCW